MAVRFSCEGTEGSLGLGLKVADTEVEAGEGGDLVVRLTAQDEEKEVVMVVIVIIYIVIVLFAILSAS